MKQFDEILKNNNVRLPKTSLGHNLFNKKWSAARCAYAYYCKAYERKSQQWERARLEIQKKWNVLLPELSKIEPPVDFQFKNAKEAESLIIQARSNLQNLIWSLQTKKENELRETWIAELISKADENTALIVIKDRSYTPYDFNLKHFNDSVSEKKSANIIMCLCPIWVAFNPHEENEDRKYWCMSKATSEVTYIQK